MGNDPIIVTHNLDLARQAHKMCTLMGKIVYCEDLSCLQGMNFRQEVG